MFVFQKNQSIDFWCKFMASFLYDVEAATGGVLGKKNLKISKYSLENICVGVSFQQSSRPPGLQLYYKKTPTQVFSFEYLEIFINTCFEEHLQTAFSDDGQLRSWMGQWCCFGVVMDDLEQVSFLFCCFYRRVCTHFFLTDKIYEMSRWANTLSRSRSSCSQMFFKIDSLKIFAVFTGKHLCWIVFFSFIKEILQHRCFPVNIAKFLRTSFFTEHQQLLLKVNNKDTGTIFMNFFLIFLLFICRLNWEIFQMEKISSPNCWFSDLTL